MNTVEQKVHMCIKLLNFANSKVSSLITNNYVYFINIFLLRKIIVSQPQKTEKLCSQRTFKNSLIF